MPIAFSTCGQAFQVHGHTSLLNERYSIADTSAQQRSGNE
jgi:hypothetical protein